MDEITAHDKQQHKMLLTTYNSQWFVSFVNLRVLRAFVVKVVAECGWLGRAAMPRLVTNGMGHDTRDLNMMIYPAKDDRDNDDENDDDD